MTIYCVEKKETGGVNLIELVDGKKYTYFGNRDEMVNYARGLFTAAATESKTALATAERRLATLSKYENEGIVSVPNVGEPID